MLKIRDGVDLKELEKIGIKEIKDYNAERGNFYVSCYETVECFGYEIKDDFNDGLDILYDLIKAHLVEKVEQ